MSILHSSDNGWIISHLKFFAKIKVAGAGSADTENAEDLYLTLNPNLFEITAPFKDKVNINGKRVKNCEKIVLEETAKSVKALYDAIFREASYKEIFNVDNRKLVQIYEDDNSEKIAPPNGEGSSWPRNNFQAVHACQQFFDTVKSLDLPHFRGENPAIDQAVLSSVTSGSILNGEGESRSDQYLFPPETRFYCNDVANMDQVFQNNDETGFDLIVMDPPWWNKFIRRRKRKQHEAGYEMIDDDGIAKLPIKRYLNDGGIVVVWCTNAKSHQDKLINEIFPKWGVIQQANLYWLKVTKSGVPICPFNGETKKQLYETVILGIKNTPSMEPVCSSSIPSRNVSKIIISVPSSINSHKPPLINVIKRIYPDKTYHRKLEIFARYLVPGFVSFGNEVVKLQHKSLYNTCS